MDRKTENKDCLAEHSQYPKENEMYRQEFKMSLTNRPTLHFISPEGSGDARRIPSIAYLRHSI